MAGRPYKPKVKTEREVAVLIFRGEMPSQGPYVSSNRPGLPFYETEAILTDLVERGLALREGGGTDTRGTWACLTAEGRREFGFAQ